DRLDLLAGRVDGERHARADGRAVDDHGAGAALAAVADDLRAGHVQVHPQRVGQRRARLELERLVLAVDPQRDGGRAGAEHAAAWYSCGVSMSPTTPPSSTSISCVSAACRTVNVLSV